MKKILVPCDFSKPAINAFRFALSVAAQSKGTVHLVHVIELPSLPNTKLTPVRSMEDTLGAKAKGQFDKLLAQYKTAGTKVVAKVEFGIPVKKILSYATDNSIDLIIMGSHGAQGMREFLVGSNAEKIVRSSPVPVLVVKDYFKGPVKNIVFPNTLETENQEDLIMRVKGLQSFFKARLHIVYINTPANFTSDGLTVERLLAFAKRYMFKDFTISVFNHRYEDEGIIQFANSINADLIVMGTHGRKGLAHLVSGSMAEDVMNHVKSLIWTYLIKKGK